MLRPSLSGAPVKRGAAVLMAKYFAQQGRREVVARSLEVGLIAAGAFRGSLDFR